jgi:hypothetical protein
MARNPWPLISSKILTEAFYNGAWRILTITKHWEHPLPEISFDSARVRNVRNQLIEHPEKNDRIFAQSFASGNETGPVLKSYRPAGQPTTYQDEGLYVNAAEFATNLLAGIARAIAKKS